jgi:hypothetical protein
MIDSQSRRDEMTATIQAAKDQLWNEMMEASKALRAFPKGNMGLTPDAVKFSHEYQAAIRTYRVAESNFKNFAKLVNRKG